MEVPKRIFWLAQSHWLPIWRSFHHPFLLARLFALSRLSFSKRYLTRGRILRVLPDIFKLF